MTTTRNPSERAAADRRGDPDGRRRRIVLAATSLGFGVVQLDVSIVNVAVKPIGTALGGSVTDLQWVVDAYTVVFAGLLLTAGALGDRWGGKRTYVFGFGLFTAGSLACAVAPDLGVLVAARAVQGGGAAVLGACSLILLTHTYTERAERARAVGFWAAGASTALAAGPLLGGVLVTTLGWRWIFIVNAPIGLVGAALTIRYARETSRARGRAVDLRGQVTATVALTALAAAAIEAGRRGLADPLVLCGISLAVLAGAGFVAGEARHERPMLPLGLFRDRSFRTSVLVGLVVNVAFYGLMFVLSLYLQHQQGLSPLATGFAFAPVMLAIVGANVLAGRMDRVLGAPRTLVAGAAVMAVGFLVLLGTGPGTSAVPVAAELAVVGFGLGVLVPAMTATLLSSVSPERSGVASGTLNAARQTGSVFGVALFGSFLAGLGAVEGLRATLAVAAALAAAAAVSGLRLRRGDRRSD